MSTNRKKEMKKAYLEAKPEMGVYAIIDKSGGSTYIGCAKDLRAAQNGGRFKLETGNFPNSALQSLWNELGAESFEIKVLEILDYDESGTKTDYTADLEALRELWIDKTPDSHRI